jgi:mannose-6-phosphate isomerase-like protein (cupin superfamily)
MAMRADHCAHRRFKDNDMTLDPRAAQSAAQLDARCKVVLPDQGECFGAFGDRIRYILTSEDTDAQFALMETETPIGSGPPLHVHAREDGFFLVQSGHYEFEIGGERIEARPGDLVFAPRDVPHTFWVAGKEPGRTINCVWPGGHDHYFRSCSKEFDTGAPDVHKISRIGNEHGVTFLTPEGVTDHMAQRQCEAGLQTRVLNQGEGERATVGDSQVRFILTQADTGGACALLELTMQPGSNVALHVHSCEDEVFIVQSGCYEFQLGNERVQAGPQTVIYAARGVPHAFHVDGEEPGHVLVFTMPGAFEEYWRRCAELGIAPHSPDAEQLGGKYGLSHRLTL